LKVKYIEELKQSLKANSINLEDICIVGSSVMTVYGLRQNRDIDILLAPKIRSRLTENKKCFNLSSNIECVGPGWMYSLDEKTKDEEIIYDSKNHFILDGFKFCNIDILLKRKKLSKKEKDILDIRLINSASKNK
jgi:hypothetical protein